MSDISFGQWAMGGNWGHVSETDALAALNNAVDSGVNFIDTADVYGDGRCSPENSKQIPSSHRMTIAPSIAMASLLMLAKRFQELTTISP